MSGYSDCPVDAVADRVLLRIAPSGRGYRALGMALLAGLVSSAAFAQTTLQPGQWVPAQPYVEMKGVTPISENGGVVGYIDGGDWVSYGPFTFADGFTDRMEIEFASQFSVGRITVHLGATNGPRIAEFNVMETGGFQSFRIQQTDAEQVSGTHRLVFVFHEGDNLGNLRAFRLLTPQIEGSPKAMRYEEFKKADALALSAVDERIEQLLAAHTPAIRQHRTTLLTIRGPPGATAAVRQTRHAFPFGTAISWRPFIEDSGMPEADRKKYLEVLEANFNSVVHENELKWYYNEREKDQVTYLHADRMLEWAEARGMEVRGHCVFWGRETNVQGWKKTLGDEELLRRMKDRARSVMTRYKGRIREWDLNNEMLHCHWYSDRFGWDIHNQMFHWARSHDPGAVLYVNDYGILTAGRTDDYIAQIRQFLADGAPLGGIGAQGHFGGRADAAEIKAKLDKLAQFGLPIRVTEFDANTMSEEQKTLVLATVYTACFAHPAIEGLTMWGFWRGAHWRPNAALWNQDWTETKAAQVYRDLVFNRWWTNWKGVIGADGTAQVRVFFGDHEVEVDGRVIKGSVRKGAQPVVDFTKAQGGTH